MKKAIVIVAAVLVILVGVALAVPFFVPAGVYTAKISEAVKSATGRSLTLGGDVGFSLFPSVGVTAENVAFANAPGAADADMATLKSLEVRLKVMPLLSGNASRELRAGRAGDRLNRPQGPPQLDIRSGKAGAPAERASRRAGRPPIGGLTLDDVRIENGRILYAGRRCGSRGGEGRRHDVSLRS